MSNPSKALQNATPKETDAASDEAGPDVQSKTFGASPKLNRPRALWSWLLLCYSTGPTFAVSTTYVPAVLQSMANLLGRTTDGTKPCARKGAIDCRVRFGAGEVNYNSYVLYLNAISRACDGACTVLVSDYRKTLLIVSIVAFGMVALPFAALTKTSYSHLRAASALYATLTAINGIYATLEGSYIPLFMRAAELGTKRAHREGALDPPPEEQNEPTRNKSFWVRGSRVSVFGLVSGNLGSLTALIIGIGISYTRGRPDSRGYSDYLLAITIAGCITVVLGCIGGIFVPTVQNKARPPGSLLVLTLARWYRLLRDIVRYPEAFKFVIGWIIWNNSYASFLSVMGLLFREVNGMNVSSGDALYTVYACTAILSASAGSLTWTFVFPHVKAGIKTWAFIFLAINSLCMLWGCIGINSAVPFGYKHGAEFWIGQVMFMSTSSALRATNRVIFASMIPPGREAQFFGLELSLDLATGWVGPLLTAAIQNTASNLRVPMVVQLGGVLLAIALYWWTDVEKGLRDARASAT